MQNFNMNDIISMMQQFGGSNGSGLQKYLQAFQQVQSQGNINNMFEAYKQFRKNLGFQGDISQEQFNSLQSQVNSIPQEQLNQVKNIVNQSAPKSFNGGM